MEYTTIRRDATLDAGRKIMKVVFCTDSIKYPLTGIGRYTFELARELQCSDEISDLLFYKEGKFLERCLRLNLKQAKVQILEILLNVVDLLVNYIDTYLLGGKKSH